MGTIKTLLFIAILFVISFSTIFFIKSSNDHIECDTIVKRGLGKNGSKVIVEEHVCKENYSF
jgi:hypothetical protein